MTAGAMATSCRSGGDSVPLIRWKHLRGDAVASVYGGSGCVELKGFEVVADLEKLLRLLTLCMLFSKNCFPVLDSVGFSQDHVLLHSPKVEVGTFSYNFVFFRFSM
ncbi:hypothetical protein ACSQ67_024964 [Phaseolus vulgaris]